MSTDSPDQTPDEIAHKFAEHIAAATEMIAPITEATLGYRRTLEAYGWSPAAAEEMAVTYYHLLMSTFTGASA